MTDNPNQDAMLKLILYALCTYWKAGLITKAEALEALEEAIQYVKRDTADAFYKFLQMQ